MPDYSEILTFLAENPPEARCERDVHASLLELLATSLREKAEAHQQSVAPFPQRPIELELRDIMPTWMANAS